MDKIRSHHFETMVEIIVDGIYRGNRSIPEFVLGGAKWISSVSKAGGVCIL